MANAAFEDMAMGQNQWYHFGVGAPLILVYLSGDSDAHWGYDLEFDPWPHDTLQSAIAKLSRSTFRRPFCEPCSQPFPAPFSQQSQPASPFCRATCRTMPLLDVVLDRSFRLQD